MCLWCLHIVYNNIIYAAPDAHKSFLPPPHTMHFSVLFFPHPFWIPSESKNLSISPRHMRAYLRLVAYLCKILRYFHVQCSRFSGS